MPFKFSSAQAAIIQLLWSALTGGVIAGATALGGYGFTRGFDLPVLALLFVGSFGGSFVTAVSKIESNPNLFQAIVDTGNEIKSLIATNASQPLPVQLSAQPAVQHVVIHTVPMPVASPPQGGSVIAPQEVPTVISPASSPPQVAQLAFPNPTTNAPQPTQYVAQPQTSGGELPAVYPNFPPGWSNTNAPIPQTPLDTRPWAAIGQQGQQ